MENQFLELLEEAKPDRKTLNMLKVAAYKCGDFDFACKVREMEVKLFPEAEYDSEISRQLTKLREMEEICWGTFTEMPKHKSFSILQKQFSLMVNVRAQIRIVKSLLKPETLNPKL
jgi:hypothetical protein